MSKTITLTDDEVTAVGYAIQDRIEILENGGSSLSDTELFEGELEALKRAGALI